MPRRISMSTFEFDTAIREMSMIADAESNTEKLVTVKKALAYVINNGLTARQKQMIVLYYYENKNMPEIAELLGVNKSTVSRTLARARRNIMERLRFYF